MIVNSIKIIEPNLYIDIGSNYLGDVKDEETLPESRI